MRTVLKLPIYVEIETDNIDRKKVTDNVKSLLYPLIIDYLAKARFRSSILGQLKTKLSVNNLDVKLLTELDLFTERN